MVRTVLSLSLATVTACAAAPLGVVSAEGDFKLNSATVRGNATLSEGSVVETLGVVSRLNLGSGARVRLDAASRARVFADRVVIEKGSGEVQAVRGYGLEAHTLRLSSEGARAHGRFALVGGERVLQVAADVGSFRVVNARGVLVTRVEPGIALALEPMQVSGGAGAPSSFLGCVLKKDNKFVLYDQTVKLLVELRGQTSAVEAEWGNKVQANGTTPEAQPTEGRQVLDVTGVTRIESGGCGDIAQLVSAEAPAKGAAAAVPAPKAAAAAGPATAPVARDGGGMSAGTKVAIIGAVVGGGAGAALAAGGGGGDRRSP